MPAVGLLAVLGLMPTEVGPASEQTADAANAKIYFLAGTPTEHTDKTYPVTLYGPDQSKKLKAVREVVQRTDGLHSVHPWGDAIFVAHPHTIPTTVEIVHTSDPTLKDSVVFNPQPFDALSSSAGFFVGDTRIALALPRGSNLEALFPLSTNFGDPSKARLISVSTNIAEKTGRVSLGRWNDYAALRSEGLEGGPAVPAGILASAVGEGLGIAISGHTTTIVPLPPGLRDAVASTPIWIVASTDEYLVVRKNLTTDELNSDKEGRDWLQTFVLERAAGRWKTLQIEGNTSRSRLFGPWLVTIVAKWNLNGSPGPGRANERAAETSDRPNVRDLYAHFEGRNNWLPGILMLQDLVDGRKIRIETGQEDSEVLRVDGDLVLYRINDAIYLARIVGDQLKDSTLIVKDEDVPEIHWAFWSK